jgi:serine/threonine protein kinase
MIGRTIGNYQITSELAPGGMGAVYRGHHLHLPREVVVKSILLGAFSPSVQVHLKARFRREAFIQSQLDHPNIVRVYEFFAGEDNYYLVMEYVQGMTLRDLLARQGVPTPAQAVYLLKQALNALDYAHNFSYLDESDIRHSGIIHRDIKPANILLDTRGKLKITDFGIVKVLGEQTGLGMTQSGFHPGTVEYMSPEQLLGLEIDVRSDIYSLGVTFYEMLAGRLPFQRSATGSDWEIRKGHIELTPPSLLDLSPEIHPQLAAIIMRSLQKSPLERYQSAAAFLEAVQSYEQRFAEKEQTLQSPAIKSTQPQPMKPTLIDEVTTLIARPAAPNQPSSSPSVSPAPSALEDAETAPLTNNVSPSASAQAASIAGNLETSAQSAQTTQPDQLKRKWLLAAGGVGLLLAGTAAGAILFSQQNTPVNTQTALTKIETPGPAPTAAATPTIQVVTKPKASPSPGERSAYKQAQALERQERYDEAIKVYENYLALNPGAEDAYVVNDRIAELKRFQGLMAAARVSMDAKRHVQAMQQYTQALQLRPNSQAAKNGLAEAASQMPTLSRPPFDQPPARQRDGQMGPGPQFQTDPKPPLTEEDKKRQRRRFPFVRRLPKPTPARPDSQP